MPRRRAVPANFPSLARVGAIVCLFSGGALLAQAPAPDASIRWQHPLTSLATVEIDVPFGWEVVEPVERGAPTRFVPVDGTHCDVLVEIRPAADTQPPIGGAEALRALVDAEASDFLDQAVESHYTLRELRGAEAAGYFYALRDRAPRKKGAAFVQRGALLVRGAVIRFTIESPKPDLPAIRQALKMLAGSRVLGSLPAPDDSAGTPAGSTVTQAGKQGGR